MRDAQEAAVHAVAETLLGRRMVVDRARAVDDHRLVAFAVELLAHTVFAGAIVGADLRSGTGLAGQRQIDSSGVRRGRGAAEGQRRERGGDDGSVRCGHGMG